jgi:hypothetical protein
MRGMCEEHLGIEGQGEEEIWRRWSMKTRSTWARRSSSRSRRGAPGLGDRLPGGGEEHLGEELLGPEV